MVLLNVLMLVSACWLGAVLLYPEPGALTATMSPSLSVASLSVIIYALFVLPEATDGTSGARGRTSTFRWIAFALGLLPFVVLLVKITLYYRHAVDMDRSTLIASAALDFALFLSLYIALTPHNHSMLRQQVRERRVLIIGSGNRARRLAETFMRGEGTPVYIVGYLDPDPSRVNRSVLGYRILGTVSDITAILKHHVIDEVVMAIPRAMIPEVERIAQACEEEGVKFCFMADLFEVRVARTQLVEFGQIPLLTHEPVAQTEWKLRVKRLIDIVAILSVLPILLPLMGLIALAIKLDSRGPIFFAQDRVGHKKRIFRMIKFRSMVSGADSMQGQVEHLNEAEGPIFKVKNDPRITKVGWWIRRTSLDELPQLFHVLSGQMSLVGPRPMSTRDVNLFDEGIQRKRFSIKPGLTCLWQISGRSQLPFTEWLRLDLQYIEQWSLSLDFKILLKTIPAVLKGEGAV
jgi:exopolysaccharide biosynthesis polyprenyl glycosylphosphotransferase